MFSLADKNMQFQQMKQQEMQQQMGQPMGQQMGQMQAQMGPQQVQAAMAGQQMGQVGPGGPMGQVGPGGPMGQMGPVGPQQLQAQQIQQMQAAQAAQAQAQQQAQQQQQQAPLPLDNNIAKIKALIGPLRESLATTIKTAAQTLHQNSQIDSGSQKALDVQIPRFDKNLEEFYSYCDQIELHLKTSIKCLSQAESSTKYLNLPVVSARNESLGMNDNSSLTYPQFLATVGAQVAYTKEIHDTLVAAAQNISPSD